MLTPRDSAFFRTRRILGQLAMLLYGETNMTSNSDSEMSVMIFPAISNGGISRMALNLSRIYLIERYPYWSGLVVS
jgi:hypothetical protein